MKGIQYFEGLDEVFDCIWLIEQVKLISLVVDHRKQKPYEYAHIILHNFLNTRQSKQDTCEVYMDRFCSYLLMGKLSGVNVLENSILGNVKTRRPVEVTDCTMDRGSSPF